VVKTTGCGKQDDDESQSDKDGSRIWLHDDKTKLKPASTPAIAGTAQSSVQAASKGV
jgi:hypothetical protein